MRIAVTGAAGHIGSEICRQLIAKGYEVNVLVNRNIKSLEGLNLTQFRGNLLDERVVKDLLQGCDVLIHAAGLIRLGYHFEQEVYDVNFTGTQIVLKLAKEWGIKKVIHFSSIEVFDPQPLDQPIDELSHFVGNQAVFYGQTKRDGHRLAVEAAQLGQDVVVVCPTSVIGPPDFTPSKLGQAILDIYKGKIFAMVAGGFNFVDVRDVANGAILAIEKGKSGETYILGGGDYTIRQLGDMVLKLKGTRRRLTQLSMFWANVGLPFVKGYAWLSGRPPLYDKVYIDILQKSNPKVSSRKAQNELGFQSRPLEETLKDTLAWFKQTGRL